jgi:hypothetical protein
MPCSLTLAGYVTPLSPQFAGRSAVLFPKTGTDTNTEKCEIFGERTDRVWIVISWCGYRM